MNNHLLIVIHGIGGGPAEKVELDAAMLESMPLARSYINISANHKVARLPDLRLLRTLSASVEGGCQEYFLEDVFRFVNLRYLVVGALDEFQLPSSVHLLWSLHTIIVSTANDLIIAPIEIWKMQQLRHVEFTSGSLIFPDPPEGDRIVLENLHTLKGVLDLKLSEEVALRIPHLKILDVTYIEMASCLSHLHHMIELERLCCFLGDPSEDYLHEVYFPHSLKRFRLICSSDCVLDLEHMLQKMASLPLLEKLMVSGDFSFPANKREITIEGRFQSLKILTLHLLPGLEKWRMPDDSSHFPLLKKLCLYSLQNLEAIPLEIGDIATLECISLVDCSETAVLSAKKIMEEQEDLHGDQLQLSVEVVYTKNYAERERDMQALQYLASPNFSILKYDHN